MATPENYEDITRNICQPCEQGCSGCTCLYDCPKCVDSYFLGDFEWNDWADDSDYYRCKAGCAKCNNKNDCTEYKAEYFISSHKDNLINCLQCPINCKSCTQNGKFLVCNECIDGYNLNEGECKGCNIKCKKYTSESQFTECSDGYLLSGVRWQC